MNREPWNVSQVSWELRPRYEGRVHKTMRAGLQLELFARGPTLADDPGSLECRAVYDRLVALARLSVPPEVRPVAFAPYDTAFHLSPGPELQPEIQLLVEIGPFPPSASGESERGVMKQLEDRLRRLGVRRRGEPSVEQRPAPQASVASKAGGGHAQQPARPVERGEREQPVEGQGPTRWVAA